MSENDDPNADLDSLDDADRERVTGRASLWPEEQAAGSADPEAQAAAILRESDIRTEESNAAPDTVFERRTSEQATGCGEG